MTNKQKIYEAYSIERETIMSLLEDIGHAIDRLDNRVINNQEDPDWGTVGSLKKLTQDLTEAKDWAEQLGGKNE